MTTSLPDRQRFMMVVDIDRRLQSAETFMSTYPMFTQLATLGLQEPTLNG